MLAAPAVSAQAPAEKKAAEKKTPAAKSPVAKPAASKVGAPKPADAKKPADASKKAPATASAQPQTAPAPASAVQPLPTPRPLPEEAQHAARYDAAIAPARDRPLSEQDAPRIRDAVRAIANGELAKGKSLRDQITDAAGRKLIDWYLYRGGYGSASESAPSWRPIRPGRTAAFSTSAPRKRCSTAPPALATSRHSSPTRHRQRASGLQPSHPRWPPRKTMPPPRFSP